MTDGTWQEIIAAFSGGSVLTLALAWLLKGLISHLLGKDVEKFKADLQSLTQKSNELYKTQLKISETRFSVLQEKRASVIAELYGKLYSAQRAHAFHIFWTAQSANQAIPKDTIQNVTLEQKALEKTQEYFNRSRILLPASVVQPIDRLFDSWDTFYTEIRFSEIPESGFLENMEKIYAEADKVSSESRKALQILSEEFRSLLGV